MELLGETVRDHMISDVPVGVLLSGGVDSTALLSFVVEASEKEVETFTVGFEGRTFADERPYARLAAQTFGSRHHEMTISAPEFLDFLPKYVWHMEEPVRTSGGRALLRLKAGQHTCQSLAFRRGRRRGVRGLSELSESHVARKSQEVWLAGDWGAVNAFRARGAIERNRETQEVFLFHEDSTRRLLLRAHMESLERIQWFEDTDVLGKP